MIKGLGKRLYLLFHICITFYIRFLKSKPSNLVKEMAKYSERNLVDIHTYIHKYNASYGKTDDTQRKELLVWTPCMNE